MSNVIDNETGRPLADGKITHTMEWWGRKIGLVSILILTSILCYVDEPNVVRLSVKKWPNA